MKRSFNIISAVLKHNNGIGIQNRLPWKHIKEDISFFYKKTTETNNIFKNKNPTINAIIMGRKTWDSLPPKYKPLKNRINIVLTKNKNKDVLTASSLKEALDICYRNSSINDIFVIGGQNVYEEAIKHPECKNIYLTKIIQPSLVDCDTFFPEIPPWVVKKENKEVVLEDKTLQFEKWENIAEPLSNENQYIDLVHDIITNGEKVLTRNGMVRKIFGPQHVFDLENGFPLLTTKKMFFDGIVKELLFFIRGETNTNILSKYGVNIWKKNTTMDFLKKRGLVNYPEGDMGPMYGFNWRHFGAEYIDCNSNYKNKGYDQLYNLIESLTTKVHDRRHLLTTYDPSGVSKSVLAPCHGIVTQFYISLKDNNYSINCKMYQRSVDVALGYPFNIASYALLVHLLCHITGYLPGKLIMTLGDTHLYESHIDQVLKQLNRIPLKQPTISIKDNKNDNIIFKNTKSKLEYLENLNSNDISLHNYHSWPKIKMDMVE